MKLKEIAHTRAGDKGTTVNIGVIPYSESDYNLLKEKLTVEKVSNFFREVCKGRVIRYEMDNISSLNFVLEDILDGLNLDSAGRSYGMAILELEL